MNTRFAPSLLLAAAIGALAAVSPANAYPTKPITMVVPFAPGGGSDVVGRLVAEALSKELGQSVVVDNRSGAGGTVGIAYLSKMRPDGYAIGIGNTSTHAVGPATLPKVPYDPVKDLVPIALVAETPYVLAASPKLEVKSVKDFIALAKSRPGKFNYGSAGAGSTTHLASAMFVRAAGVQMEHVAYKGNAPAVTALLTGEIEMLMGTLPSLLGQIKSGAVRPLAVASARRSPEVPDLPTIQEAGVPGYEASIWYGLVAPAGTPPEAIKRLQDAVAKIMKDEELGKKIRASGAEPLTATPQEFAKKINDDLASYKKLVQDIGLKPN
jgi:tripartite-type tricarboxylate transporter receptor subunit TctC